MQVMLRSRQDQAAFSVITINYSNNPWGDWQTIQWWIDSKRKAAYWQ